MLVVIYFTLRRFVCPTSTFCSDAHGLDRHSSLSVLSGRKVSSPPPYRRSSSCLGKLDLGSGLLCLGRRRRDDLVGADPTCAEQGRALHKAAPRHSLSFITIPPVVRGQPMPVSSTASFVFSKVIGQCRPDIVRVRVVSELMPFSVSAIVSHISFPFPHLSCRMRSACNLCQRPTSAISSDVRVDLERFRGILWPRRRSVARCKSVSHQSRGLLIHSLPPLRRTSDR